MQTKKSNWLSPVLTNFWVDFILFAAAMAVLSPIFTGIALHEWLGIAIGGAVVLHLLLHWRWTVSSLKRFFGRLSSLNRINLVLNLALFIDMVVAIFTGLMISRSALPWLGISLPGGFGWRGLHSLSSNLLLVIVALHVGIHWKWILNVIWRYALNPIFSLGQKPGPSITSRRPEVDA